MYRFLVIVEQTDGNYSAYSPDLAAGAWRPERPARKWKSGCTKRLSSTSKGSGRMGSRFPRQGLRQFT
ncbi:hypothetical protein [Methanoculleus nereidis]|uniref:hypothetical protein n=1 Tax=Methanoculleus nereidis TaxID=2735141 RepID=UPI002943973D|nr:hypothetical protein [Methanoculleus sp. YWC-01]